MTSDGLAYIASRPAPAHLTAADAEKENVAVVHRVQLGADEGSAPSASTVRFPRPENVWMSRDVDRADWAAFTKHLFPRRQRPGVNGSSTTDNNGDGHKDDDETADETTRRQRLIDIVGEWNRDFFEPRGLSILAQFGDDVVEATASPDGEGDVTETPGATGDSSSKQPNRGYGLKLGNSLLGVSMGPQSHGYGLRLGGVLLGVRVDKDQDGKDDNDGDVKDK